MIRKASDQYLGKATHPVEGAIKTNHGPNFDGFNWEVEINTLDDLMMLMVKLNDAIIIQDCCGPRPSPKPKIVIYDDYME